MNKRGIDRAVEQTNQEGGIRGRPLRVAMRNDKDDGVRAVSIPWEFVNNRDVVERRGATDSLGAPGSPGAPGLRGSAGGP